MMASILQQITIFAFTIYMCTVLQADDAVREIKGIACAVRV